MHEEETYSPASLALGVALALIASFFLLFALDIKESSLASDNDPGPRALPTLLACGVLLGGLVEIARSAWRFTTRKRTIKAPRETMNAGAWKVVGFAGLLLVYLLAAPFAFYTSSFAFVTITVTYLGGRLWSAAAFSLAIVVVMWALFVKLFLVPLPTLLETIRLLAGAA